MSQLHRRHRRALAGFFDHLHARDTTYAMVSRAPLAKLERWKERQGWDIPWYSSFGSTFNADFGVTVDPTDPAATYNFRDRDELERGGRLHGRRRALRDARPQLLPPSTDRVFHTYSQYARGLESTGGSYYFLDLTALGRQEEWEEPKGRSDNARAATPDFAD